MPWEERQSYGQRARRSSGYWAVLNGKVPILPVGRVRVAVHASFLLTALLLLVCGPSRNVRWPVRIECVAALFAAVLAHEAGQLAGRRFASERDAGEMVLTSLGGQASLAGRLGNKSILAILCGPAANFLLCAFCALILWRLHSWTLNPVRGFPTAFTSWKDPGFHFRVLYSISAAVLLLNLLPLFPLDAGKILQLWLARGEGIDASINMTTLIGLLGSGMLAIIAIGLQTWLLLFIAGDVFVTCLAIRWLQRPLRAAESDGSEFTANLRRVEALQRRRRLSRWTVRRLRRLALQEEQEQHALDAILAKVSAFGIQSLTWRERRALKQATSRQWAGEDEEADLEPRHNM